MQTVGGCRGAGKRQINTMWLYLARNLLDRLEPSLELTEVHLHPAPCC